MQVRTLLCFKIIKCAITAQSNRKSSTSPGLPYSVRLLPGCKYQNREMPTASAAATRKTGGHSSCPAQWRLGQCCNSTILIVLLTVISTIRHQDPKSRAPLQECHSYCLYSSALSTVFTAKSRSWVRRGFQTQPSLQSLGPGDGWVHSLPFPPA